MEVEDENKQISLEDFEQICRVCLAHSSYTNLKPLIPAILQVLRGITQVKIENQQDDQLPRNICSNCSNFLQDVLAFADTCRSNESILKRVLEDSRFNRDRKALLKQLESESESDNDSQQDAAFKGWDDGQEDDNLQEENSFFQSIEEDSDDDKPLHIVKQEQQKENNTKLANEKEEKPRIRRRKIKSDIPLKSVRRRRGKNKMFKVEREEHTNSKIPVCVSCSTTFTSKTKLCSHYKENEACRPAWFEVFQCKICQKEFSTERRRDEHLNVHTGETPYMCTYCGKSFQLYTAHYKHVYKHRLALGEVELKPGYTERRVKLNLQCDQCPKIFASRSGFANHLLMHKGIKVVYKRRPKKEGTKSKEKKYLCNHCGKGFMTKMQLDGHIRAHTGKRPFHCSFCGKEFRTKGSLHIHEMNHMGERPFHCSFCGKEFRTKGSLRIHEMNHMGTTPKRFICEVCNKPFALKAHFEVHQRTHTGEKPYSCHFCGKCFNYQGTLKIHLRLHTGETPYVCPVCPSRYHDKSALNKHQKKHGHEGEAIVEETTAKTGES